MPFTKVAVSDSKLLDFEILDYSNLFFQIPGFPGGLEFKFNNLNIGSFFVVESTKGDH